MTETADRPLRIALCSGRLGSGGIGMVMLHLAGALQRQGHAVDLLHFAEPAAGLAGRAVPPGCTPVAIGARSRQALPGLLRYLRAARPDLVITARDYIHVMMLAARRLSGLGRPGSAGRAPALIWTFHTHRASELAHQAGRADRLADRLMRRGLGRVEGLVAVSQGVAAGLVQDLGLPPARLATIPNPVWTASRRAARLAPCPHPWLAGRAPLARPFADPAGPDVDAPVLLAVGRLTPQKDFATLIAALALVQVSVPGARLIILGEGPGRAALEAQISSAGLQDRVDLAGHVPDVLPYLARADLFVMSSRWEGFPLALVEAMGCGAPVVSTDCPAGPHEILQGGRLGRLVDPGNPVALAEGIRAALADPGDSAAAMDTALGFDDALAATRYLALGRQALAARRGRA